MPSTFTDKGFVSHIKSVYTVRALIGIMQVYKLIVNKIHSIKPGTKIAYKYRAIGIRLQDHCSYRSGSQ